MDSIWQGTDGCTKSSFTKYVNLAPISEWFALDLVGSDTVHFCVKEPDNVLGDDYKKNQ
jgi:hypothetical protein